jgi:PAS domain S-box-containing protein
VFGRRSMKADLPHLARIAGLAVVYFAAARLGVEMKFGQVSASPVWPPGGLALAALLLLGRRLWPGVLLGSFAFSVAMLGMARGKVPQVLAVSLVVSAGSTLEALAGAWLAERFAGGRKAFNQPHNIFRFVAFTAILSTLISPCLGLTSLSLAGFERFQNFGPLWLAWWLGGLTSVVMLTPLLLVWSSTRWPALNLKRLGEGAALTLLLAGVCWLVFGGGFAFSAEGAHLSFLLIPPLLWAALRFGQRGTASLAFIIACVAIVGTLHARGPFTGADRFSSLLFLQNFIAGITVLSLMLAADVAQHQKAEAQLRDSEQHYRELFEANPQPMWVLDYETLRFLAVNEAALKHYGYSRADFLGMRVSELWPPADVPAQLEAVQRGRAGGSSSHQRHHRTKAGAIIDVELACHNLLFEGRPAAMVLSTDITERKRAEKRAAAFSELGRRLSAAETPKQAGWIICETADALLGWDLCLLDLCSPQRTEAHALVYIDTVNGQRVEVPSATSKVGPYSLRALEQGPQLILRPAPAEFAPQDIPVGDKSRPSASLMHVPLLANGQPIGVLSIQSYTPNAYTPEDLRLLQALAEHCGGALERIRAEAAARESDDRLHLALEAGKMGTWSYELGPHPLLTASAELAEILGLNPAEFPRTDRGLLELVHADDRERVRRAMVQAVAKQGEYELQFRFLPRGRPVGWLLTRGRAYHDAQGKALRLTGVAVDITELEAAQEEVLRLNAELEERVYQRTAQMQSLNKELEAFSYSVSHDLRAPLRSIRGFSEVLLARYSSKLDARGQEFLQRSAEASQHMDNLIEDLLKLSRLGRAELRRQTVGLSALVESLAAELRQAEPQRQVQFLIAPAVLAQGDERLLRVVLDNLLRNAWKFTAKTPNACIEFGMTHDPEPAFFIRDNGAGFDPAYAHKLFGVFQRLHSASEFPGTGIGLATVQRIINRHGGRVWASGAVDQGATFYFTLPGGGGA